MIKTVLVTGGCGYVGSHIVLALHRAGHNVVIVDNMTNAIPDTRKNLNQLTKTAMPLYKHDVGDYLAMRAVFEENRIDAVIHCAGLKYIADSNAHPAKYFETNLAQTITLTEAMRDAGINQFIFSSSCTVYDDTAMPLTENSTIGGGANPYAASKIAVERYLADLAKWDTDFSAVNLRYFNPIGADESGLLGERKDLVPKMLMQAILQAAYNPNYTMTINGDTHDTEDGTCVRDFVHVSDIAEAHVKALTLKLTGVQSFNLGSGGGISVKNLIEVFETVSGKQVKTKVGKAREGDLPVSYCRPSKALRHLNWYASKDLFECVRSHLNFWLKSHGGRYE